MSGSTTNYAIPFPVGGDTVGAAIVQALAERVEYLFTGWWGPVPQYVAKAGDTMTGDLAISKDGADANLIVGSDPGKFAALTFSTDLNFRWVVRKNPNAEAGANVGSDLEIMRFADNGAFLGVAFTMNRANGESFLYERLTIQPPSSSTAQAIAVIRDDVTKSVLTGRKATDTQQRFSIHADGETSWGPGGATARDTYLRRNQAGVLQTDGNLVRAGMNVVSVATTITPDDYLNVLTGTTARAFTLPPVAGNSGVELLFKNRCTALVNLTIQRTGIVDQIWGPAGAVSSITVAQHGSVRLINDGSYWLQV